MKRAAAVTLLALTGLVTGGCGAVNLIRADQGSAPAGKALFVSKCGACHTLANAGTKGVVGPNLDDAFASVKAQGFHLQSLRDLVRGQIAYSEADPGTGTADAPNPGMPPNIVVGQQARDVAVYVAQCAGVKSCGIPAG